MSTNDEAAESNGRATVALVDAKVATVDAKVSGLTDLMRAEFKELRREVGEIGQLSAKVDGQGDRLLLAESRLTTLERARDVESERHKWRATDLPNILIGLGILALAAVQFFT